MKQAKELGEKLATTEIELETLRTCLNKTKSNFPNAPFTSDSDDVKEATELKLRKYAGYIKQVEEERSIAYQAMKRVGFSFNEEDFVGSISTICERLVSMKEECERAKSCLLEVRHGCDSAESLDKKIVETENQLKQVLREKQDIQLKLEEASHVIESLQKVTDELSLQFSSKESEQNRQISYLEKENLQLMHDLKNTKKEAQKLRIEIEGIHRGVQQETTEDLKGLSLDLIAAPVFEKLSSETSEVKKISTKASPPTPIGSVLDILPSTGEDTDRSRFRQSYAPSLGESNDEEATGECRQS
jgi:chromosome segregation ATPase